MSELRIIKPTEKILKTETSEPISVCAYCRVSTDETDQRNSLVSQKQFFESYFKKHRNWTNVGIFADEGISGTSLDKRDEFNKMVSLARRNGINLILTKEVSRFSRNVLDLLNIVEELRSKKVYIWFLSDDINTESADYRERLTQSATNAEIESLRTSRRVKWGQRQKMIEGTVFGRKEMFGYRIERDESGEQRFIVVEDEAEIIQKIFEWFSSGDGTHIIARRLESMGIKTLRYKNGWSNTVILRILRNEKYVGDLEQGKTYTPDPLTHKKKYNKGSEQRYYIENHHPESAIIDRETWNKVQALLKEKEPSEEVKAMHSNRYWTSGKIFCGLCGRRYVSLRKKQKNTPYKAWICLENHTRGTYKETEQNGETVRTGCNAKRVNDRVLKMAVHDILTEIIIPNQKEICNSILEERKKAKPKDHSRKIAAIQKKIEKKNAEISNLTRKFVSNAISDTAYNLAYNDIEKEIGVLNFQLSELATEYNFVETSSVLYDDYIEQINKIVSLTDEQLNEGLYERITKKIVVYPLNIIELHLSFMLKPIYLQYQTHGKGNDYNAVFTILTNTEFEKLKMGMPKNNHIDEDHEQEER